MLKKKKNTRTQDAALSGSMGDPISEPRPEPVSQSESKEDIIGQPTVVQPNLQPCFSPQAKVYQNKTIRPKLI